MHVVGLQLDAGTATLQCINPVPLPFRPAAAAAPKEPPMLALITDHSAKALAGAILLLLAACAAEPAEPAGPDATRGSALPPPGAGEPATATTTPSAPPPPLPEPSSTSQPPAEPGASGEPVVVKGPDGTSWEARGVKDEAAYQADLDDCYSYATAQTRHDAQMKDDRNAGIDTLTSQSRYSGLRQRVDEYDLRNRRASLMSSCMESKGYARADTVLPRLEF